MRFYPQYSPNLIFKHLRSTLAITDRRVVVQSPSTIFDIFPVDMSETTSPLHAVADVSAGDHQSTRKIAMGAVATIMALLSLITGFAGGPLAPCSPSSSESWPR